jgi:poly(3-hydroxybutyrate) depolymerase
MTGWLLPLVLLVAEPTPAPLPAGAGKIEVETGGHKLEVFAYKPKDYKDGPLIVVFHGMLRNADTYRDNGRGMGDRFGALIVAPLFDTRRFPNESYQLGGLLRRGEVQPAEQWTGKLVPKIVDEVRRREGRPDMPYYLIGHSAGGQFLSRIVGSVSTGAQRIVAANPGSHLFPTRDMPFPYGFGKLPPELSDDAALKRYLAQPLTIYVGTADTGSQNLPQGETAMKQGATRYERGKNCFQIAQELARTKGWEFNWRLVEAPDISHDAKAMFDHKNCAEALFPARKSRPSPNRGTRG